MGTSLRRLLVIILRQPISISIQDGYVVVLFFNALDERFRSATGTALYTPSSGISAAAAFFALVGTMDAFDLDFLL